jgi:hypothetical protein
MFMALCVVNIIVVTQYYKGRTKRGDLVFTLLITAVLLVNIIVGTRYILRDTLWKDTIMIFWILFLMTYILKNFAGIGLGKLSLLRRWFCWSRI